MSAIDIARGLTQLRPDWNIDGPYQFGEIGAVGAHGANTVDVYLDGSTSLTTGLHYSADYGPQVNDPVMIGRMQGSSQSARVVLGPLAPGGTINGGPPTSTPYAGARIFDTKYGVTWWYDGTNWRITGAPGKVYSLMTNSVNQTFNNNSVTAVSLNQVMSDPLSLVSASVFTCPVAGLYQLRCRCWLSNFSTATWYTALLAIHGTDYDQSPAFIGTGGGQTPAITTSFYCAAGDPLSFQLSQTSGTSNTTFVASRAEFRLVSL